MSQIQSFSRLSAILTMDNTQFLRGTEVASKKLAAFSAKATTLGANITRSLGVGLALVGTAAVKTAADYNRATATLGAIVGKNSEALAELNAQSEKLGRTSIFTATQVAEAQLEIKKLGFQADRTKAIIKSATDIAAIFGGSIEDVGKAIASALNQFGLEAEESGNVADIMAVAFRDSALDISKFREAMKNVGPTAKATGLSLEKTTALLAVLANNAVDGSLGGTKLRSTLSDLAKKFPDAARGLKSLENGTLSYAELVELLNKRAALVGAIFQDQGDAIEEMEKKLQSATGTTNRLSQALEGELFYNVERVKAATESLGISVGNALAPLMSELADSMEEFAQAVAETDPKLIEGIAVALLKLVKLGAFSLLAGQLAGFANALATFATVTIPNFAAAMAGLSGAFGVAVGGGGLLGAILLLSEQIDEFFKKMDETGDGVLKKHEDRVRALHAKYRELANVLFDLLPLQERLEGFNLGMILELDGEESAVKRLSDEEFLLQNQLDAVAQRQKALNEARQSGLSGRELDTYKNKLNFAKEELKKQEEIIRKVKRYLELVRKNQDLKPPEEEAAPPVVKGTGKIKFDNEGFLLGLRRDLELEFARVFGQNFMFDELTLSDQLVALMNGQPILTSDAFDAQLSELTNELEALQDEFEDVFDNEDASINKLADTFIRIRDGLEGATQVAQGFANVVGEAFLVAIDGAETFGEALKNGFLAAFKAIIAKLITLITLYAVLAVLSGGTSMANGGSFGGGVGQFVAGNNFGDFIKTGLSAGRSSSFGGSGGSRSIGINVGGGLMGGDIAFANSSGRSANDRRFG